MQGVPAGAGSAAEVIDVRLHDGAVARGAQVGQVDQAAVGGAVGEDGEHHLKGAFVAADEAGPLNLQAPKDVVAQGLLVALAGPLAPLAVGPVAAGATAHLAREARQEVAEGRGARGIAGGEPAEDGEDVVASERFGPELRAGDAQQGGEQPGPQHRGGVARRLALAAIAASDGMSDAVEVGGPQDEGLVPIQPEAFGHREHDADLGQPVQDMGGIGGVRGPGDAVASRDPEVAGCRSGLYAQRTPSIRLGSGDEPCGKAESGSFAIPPPIPG